MWVLIGAIVVIVVFALWFRRTPTYRARRSGQIVAPGQGGWDAKAWHHGHGWRD